MRRDRSHRLGGGVPVGQVRLADWGWRWRGGMAGARLALPLGAMRLVQGQREAFLGVGQIVERVVLGVSAGPGLRWGR